VVEEKNYPELKADNIVDGYLTKAAEGKDIVNCLENIFGSKS
jgi:hypothetical protein